MIRIIQQLKISQIEEKFAYDRPFCIFLVTSQNWVKFKLYNMLDIHIYTVMAYLAC